MCLSAILKEDPFISFLDSMKKKSLEKSQKLAPLNLTKELSEVKSLQGQNFAEVDFNNVELQFIKLNLMDKMASYQKFAVHSLWKIESQHNFNSDFIKWNTPYRFRHFVTGKYLRLPDKPIKETAQVFYFEYFRFFMDFLIRIRWNFHGK